MAKQTVMNIVALKRLLKKIGNEVGDDYKVWMSSDEEGNQLCVFGSESDIHYLPNL